MEAMTMPPDPDSLTSLLAVRGIAKELFDKLGGGEQFIRDERNDFGGNREAGFDGVNYPGN